MLAGFYLSRLRRALYRHQRRCGQRQRENDFAVFKNVFNDYYARDTSKKIRAVVRLRGEAGEHIASNPPYGYVKAPLDKKKWVVDEEAANAPRRFHIQIFYFLMTLHVRIGILFTCAVFSNTVGQK